MQLQTDGSNYYDMVSTQDSVGDYLADGQNMVRFWMAHATQTGSPDPINITKVVLKVPMKTGKSQTVVIGKLTIQESNLFFLRYYSNRLFIDGTTGAWKETPASGDLINLNRDAIGILHYETARLVVQAATTDRSNQGESARFDTELTRKYAAYFKDRPSSAEPLSYSISPDLARQLDPFYGGFADDVENGLNIDVATDLLTTVNFADNETPVGAFNDVNTVFMLLHQPSPATSMMLILNGQVLAYGSDYTVSGKFITFSSPPSSLFTGLPFSANYRFYV